MASIFISFQHDDAAHREGLEGMLRNPNNTFRHVPVSARDDVRSDGEAAVKRYLKDKIAGSDMLLCLVGNNTHQSRWVEYELQVARSWRVPVVAVRLPGHGMRCAMPAPIANQRLVPWSEASVALQRALNSRR